MTQSVFTRRYRRFLQLLKQSRLDANLTQVQVAAKLRRPQSFVSKCESGERRVDLVELVAFCEAYDADVRDFIERFLNGLPPGHSPIENC